MSTCSVEAVHDWDGPQSEGLQGDGGVCIKACLLGKTFPGTGKGERDRETEMGHVCTVAEHWRTRKTGKPLLGGLGT